MKRIKIVCKLFFTFLVILFAMPYFHLHNILFAKIVNNEVGATHIASTSLDIEIPYAIDNWFYVEKEFLSPFFFVKL